MVILTDDEPALDLRLINYMPNAKAIWKDAGVTFTDFHIESPLCCPGRAGFLTGQHTFNHGVTHNDVRLFKPGMSLATQLHGLGYYTMLAGKYFNQYAKIAPTVPVGWDRFTAFAAATDDSNYYNYDLYNDGDPVAEHHGSLASDYSTDVIAAKAVSMIQSAPADKPIFAWITPIAPHPHVTAAPRYAKAPCPAPAWQVASSNEADVSDKPDYVQKRPLVASSAYSLTVTCRTMLAVDDLVGGVRDALAAGGRLDNTIFVYTSDNGLSAKEHRFQGKGWPYITSVPFYVSWPAGLGTSPRTVSERLENVDFAPTVCAIAGCGLGPYANGQTTPDGLSFTQLLFGTQTHLSRDAVIEDMPKGTGSPAWYSITTTAADQVVPGGPWHYIETAATSGINKELYDLSGGPCWTWSVGQPGDPCELNNLLADPNWSLDSGHAAILTGLQQRLVQLKHEKGIPPSISLQKAASPSSYAAVNDQITYTYTVTNTGNVTLTGPFSVTDDRLGTVDCGSGPLAPGAQLSCQAAYAVTQTDLDAGSIVNTATASGSGVTSPSATATVTASQSPSISLQKVASPSSYQAVNDQITYTYTVTNTGNVTLTGSFSVTDDRLGTVDCGSGPLAPGAQLSCSTTYTVTQADLDAGSIVNTAVASGGGVTSPSATATVTFEPEGSFRALPAFFAALLR